MPTCVSRFRHRLGQSILIFGLLVSAGMTAGCQTTPKKTEPEMATPDKAAALRESIQKAQPGAQVGRVIVVLTDAPYAAVIDLPVQDVKAGQTITFVDGEGNPVSNGTVAEVVGDAVHVKFDKAGKRPPQKGDLAVWLKS
jgi:hypothetical protein